MSQEDEAQKTPKQQLKDIVFSCEHDVEKHEQHSMKMTTCKKCGFISTLRSFSKAKKKNRQRKGYAFIRTRIVHYV